MWKDVREKYEGRDMYWLMEGMKNNSLVWCADGSYKRKVAPFVSGAGWMVYCTKSKKSMEGQFFEYSDSANAYRAEQLGLDDFLAEHQFNFGAKDEQEM